MNELYDKNNPNSIISYAKKLIGKTFEEAISENKTSNKGLFIQEATVEYGSKSRKGGLGNLIEEKYFGYKANSDSEADFKNADIELKVTPYEIKHNKNNEEKYVAGERLVLTMIAYDKPVIYDFYQSHVWNKCKNILLIYYLRDKNIVNNLLYKIKFVELFTPPKEDLIIIKQDYNAIITKISQGKAHELSEGDTLYLGACTKGKTAATSLVPQYYNKDILAKKRAYCYKTSYMTFVLNHYIIGKKNDYEKILDLDILNAGQTFEEIIENRLNAYVNKTDKDLCKEFNIVYDQGKAQWTNITYKLLGIKSNKAEEFVKSNVVVKAIRIEEDGNMIESSPLPTIRFKEILSETWETSKLYNYFEETRFLFVVFKKKNGEYFFKGCQFWNIPYDDLNTYVFNGWKEIREIISKGVQFELYKDKNGKTIVKNNLPSKSFNKVIHMRPHAQKAYYKLKTGYTIGKESDGDELPDGQYMTRQSFWINNSYIISILNDKLK